MAIGLPFAIDDRRPTMLRQSSWFLCHGCVRWSGRSRFVIAFCGRFVSQRVTNNQVALFTVGTEGPTLPPIAGWWRPSAPLGAMAQRIRSWEGGAPSNSSAPCHLRSHLRCVAQPLADLKDWKETHTEKRQEAQWLRRVPPRHVDQRVHRAGGVEDVERTGRGHLGDAEIGHGLPGDEVQIRGEWPARRVSRVNGEEARRSGSRRGYVGDDRRGSRWNATVTAHLDVESAARREGMPGAWSRVPVAPCVTDPGRGEWLE